MEITINYSPNIPVLLEELGCSLITSNYSSQHVLCIETNRTKGLDIFPFGIAGTYGMDFQKGILAASSYKYINIFRTQETSHAEAHDDLGEERPVLAPEICYDLGGTEGVRDVHLENNGKIWVANSAHSCICTISGNGTKLYSPQWKPHFISSIQLREDRCHLNGLACEDGQPKYVTALSQTNVQSGWRSNIMKTGILMDVPSNEVILKGLGIPHTPRIINGQLFMLISGKGQLICVDPQKGNYEVVIQFTGFARGMAQCGEYLFVGISRAKKESSSFGKLEIPNYKEACGISVVHLPSGNLVGEMTFSKPINDVYDIIVYPQKRSPQFIIPPKNNPKAISLAYQFEHLS